MPSSLLAATTRTIQIVGREEELESIHRAIYDPTRDCEVVLLYGRGGLGKSRILEEVLLRSGNLKSLQNEQENYARLRIEHPDWTSDGSAIVSDIVDLNDVRLHARGQFIYALREAFAWAPQVDFEDYDRAYKARRQAVQHGAQFEILQALAQEEENAFLNDLAKNSEQSRLVWVIDTAEQLANFSSDWLLKHELLNNDELAIETQQWLKDQIRKKNLHNTTILLAGREEEGTRFFQGIEQVIEQTPETCRLTKTSIRELNEDKTTEFFNVLAQEWKTLAPNSTLSKTMSLLAQDQERLQVLHVYTAGQALLLSLYGDILLEGNKIPDLLTESLDEAKQRIQQKSLKDLRFEIENEFIALLFGTPSLRSEILKALVRARRGLNSVQLHFALDSTKELKASNWKPNPQRLQEIENELVALNSLSIIKLRPDERVALQDEIYRIYADHIQFDVDAHEDERAARQRLYYKLFDWAGSLRSEIETQRRQIQKQDEQNLRIQSPANASKVRFAPLTEEEEERRIRLHEELRDLELEVLHYALLQNPQVNLNDEYSNLAQGLWLASDENARAMAWAELWSVLSDKNALAFVKFERDEIVERRNETYPEVLQRVAQQTDVVRWLQRFFSEQNYKRVVELCDQVQNVVNEMPEGIVRNSWNHTFARGQRTLWRELARIVSGNDVQSALETLETTVKNLQHLANTPRSEQAFSEEWGFKGYHAESELERVIAFIYNALGYGYTLIGSLHKGVEMYGLALHNLRESYFRAQEAETRNNLSRALSDLGRQRARRVCLDALHLRREIGEEVPIGLSLNTLALIDNDQGRPDRAWVEAAQALAYFRRAEYERGIGLALLQLAEGLRRLARDVQQGRILSDEDLDSQILLREAERALTDAMQLYANSGAKAESPRQIEAYIEMGSIQRDYLDPKFHPREFLERKRRYENALDYLNKAATSAQKHNLKRFELDALVNSAWTHYFFARSDLALEALEQIEREIPSQYHLERNQPPPSPRADATYMYYQLSKICGLRGRIAMEEFRTRVDHIQTESPKSSREQLQMQVQTDQIALQNLERAAEAYVLGIAYAQIFSPRSNALSTLYDALYESLKRFNRGEIRIFVSFVHNARVRYRVAQIQLDDLGDLENFIKQLFGSQPQEERANVCYGK